MEAPKCWSCGGGIEMKHYPVSICKMCHHAGSGLAARDPLKRENLAAELIFITGIIQKARLFREDIVKAIEEFDNAERRGARKRKADRAGCEGDSPSELEKEGSLDAGGVGKKVRGEQEPDQQGDQASDLG